MGKWGFLKGKYPAAPLDGDRFAKMSAILDSVAPTDLVSPDEAEKKFTLRQLSDFQLNRYITNRRTLKARIEAQLDLTKLELEAVEREIYKRFDDTGKDNTRFEDGVLLSKSEEPYPVVTDEAALLAWIKTNQLEDILSLNWQTMKTMVKEILLPEKGKDQKFSTLPPGVDVFYKQKLRRSGGAKIEGDQE